MIIFLRNLYIFVWLNQSSLAYTVFVLSHSNSVIKEVGMYVLPVLQLLGIENRGVQSNFFFKM